MQHARQISLTNRDLDAALEEEQFRLACQPKIELGTARILAAHCHLSWHHPVLGAIPVPLFMDHVEHRGRRGELTRHLLRSALRDCRLWRLDGRGWRVSVPLATADLTDGACPPPPKCCCAHSTWSPAR